MCLELGGALPNVGERPQSEERKNVVFKAVYLSGGK